MDTNIHFVYTVLDGKGETSEVDLAIYNVGDETYIELYEGLIAALPIVRNIIVGGIVAAHVRLPIGLGILFSSFPGIPIPEQFADVEERAKFVFLTETKVEARRYIPTFDETLVLPSSKRIDFADLRVAAYVDMMTAGIVTGSRTFELVDSHGERLQSVDSGEENFKPRKRKRPNRR